MYMQAIKTDDEIHVLSKLDRYKVRRHISTYKITNKYVQNNGIRGFI